jgi:hypothetical protein
VTQHKKKRLAKKNKSTSQTKSAVIKEKKQEEPSLESNRTPNSEPSIIEKKQEEQIAAIDYSYFERYLGIYSIQYDNGNTRMFKFSMNLSNNNLNVLYQDNISGNSKIEMYKLLNFDQSSGRIVLESKNNSNEKTRLYLKTDAESKNGYKLVDENSVEYTFLLKD